MDFATSVGILLESEFESDIKLFMIVLLKEIDFTKDIYSQMIDLSFKSLFLKTKWHKPKAHSIVKKSEKLGIIKHIRGGINKKNSVNRYLITKKLFNMEHIMSNKYNNWVTELAVKWVEWRRERGLEKNWPTEEYAMYIEDASHLIPNYHEDGSEVNKQKWMFHAFDYIKKNSYWQSACATPHMLKDKVRGEYKIHAIFIQCSSKQNKQKILSEELKKVCKNSVIPF